MAFESQTGLGTMSQYGPRDTGNTVGTDHSQNAFHELNFEITGAGLADPTKFLPPYVVPKGATMKRAIVTVDVAPAGITAFSVGEGNASGTNGLVLAAADLAVGTRDVTSKLAGTWAATSALTKASQVGMAVTGTNTVAGARFSIVIEYVYKRRKDDEFKVDPSTKPTGYRPQFVG